MASIDRSVSFGMSSVRFRPSDGKADLIQNMIVTPDGTLKSIDGFTLYEPRHLWSSSPTNPGKVHAIFHCYFGAGEKEVLLMHAGRQLWRHVGAKRGWIQITAPRGFRSDSEMSCQSTFLKFGNYVIFTDGAGPPVIIDEQFRCMYMGFADTPSAPSVKGPASVSQEQSVYYDEGAVGYSWPGGLGTPGDRLNGDDAHILRGRWTWCVRYVDYWGNYSALSVPSNQIVYGPVRSQPAALDAATTNTRAGVRLGGMQRGAAVEIPSSVPVNCERIQVGRTKDTNRNDSTFYVAREFASTGGFWHDRKQDGGLVEVMEDAWPMPVVNAMCVDRGSLLAISGPYLYVSEPGFPGTLPKQNRLMVTADGKAGSAVFALNGRRLAATETSIIDVTDLASPVVVSNNIGIAGPKAWAYLPGNTGIVFVNKTGVYTLGMEGVQKISGDIEYKWETQINTTRLQQCVVWYSSRRDEVRIAVTPKGLSTNTLILAYSSLGWRQHQLGLAVTCQTDANDLELVGGDDGQSRGGGYSSSDVYVLEKETSIYTPPARQSIYESDYIRFDESLGYVKGILLSISIGFIETYEGEGATIEYEVNYENGLERTHTMRLDDTVGTDAHTGSTRRKAWDSFLIGTDTFKERRKAYRKFQSNFENIHGFKFKIYTDYPNQLELIDMVLEWKPMGRPQNTIAGMTEV